MVKKIDEADIELLPIHTYQDESPYRTGLEDDEEIHRTSRGVSPGRGNFSNSIEETQLLPQGSGALLDIDKPAFYILVLLYFLQGIPVGLAFGSIPFLMKSSHLSYSQVGTFSLASYPYSLKLFWSPFVDSFYSQRFGRRRSWIIPVQTVTGVLFILLGLNVDLMFEDLVNNVNTLTTCFFILVLMASTQDIAVDSWALVILSPLSKSYASTAQTVGLNTGYFLSFTVFLAFNSKEFMNKYFRSSKNQKDTGLISLGQYMILSGILFLICTAIVAYKVPEVPEHLRRAVKKDDELTEEEIQDELDNKFNDANDGWGNLKRTYLKMFRVLSLSTVQQFIIILLICKFGFVINEGATNLKLLDKGFSKEDLSLTVLIDFPFEIVFGYYVAKWSRGNSALEPWLYAYVGRLIAALFGQLIVYGFPTYRNADGIEETRVTLLFFFSVVIQHLFSSLMGTIQFVSLAAFHTRIADPIIGGTYMTTLNTLSNFGGTWPKFFLFKFIDKMTYAVCVPVSLNTSSNSHIRNFEQFWDNLKSFLLLGNIGGTNLADFEQTPTEMELQNFKSFNIELFDLAGFFEFLNSHFLLTNKLETLKQLAISLNLKVTEYLRFSKSDKISFWHLSGQLKRLPTCSNEPTKQICLNYFKGLCVTVNDGYYQMNLVCVAIGSLLLFGFIWKKVKHLQSLDESHWRVK